jgi:hypothetical protein
MNFTDFMINAGVLKNALGRCGLASVNVSGNTDIAVSLDGSLASHNKS